MHSRFFNIWGPMPEDIVAISAEKIYNDAWKRGKGLDIIQSFPQTWHHLGDLAELGIVHPPDRRS